MGGMIGKAIRLVCRFSGGARRRALRIFVAVTLVVGGLCFTGHDAACLGAAGRNQQAFGSNGRPPAEVDLAVSVVSETGEPVSSAQISITAAKDQRIFRGETDYSGKFTFVGLVPGVYQLRVEKDGFYVETVSNVLIGKTRSVRITLSHLRRIAQSIKVVYSPPMIDPTETSSNASLNGRDIIDLPYSVPRDIRYALPLLPGVMQDATGQIHVDGSATSQVLDDLDGFDLTDPVTGDFDELIAPEALRSVNVEDSRYSVEYGRASGGVLELDSSMGDDHYRFAGVNFLPTLADQDGLQLSSWTPRAVFSGPLRRGKAWFMDGFSGLYNLSIVNGLPPSANRSTLLRFDNLARAQVNLTPSNILTASFLVDGLSSPHEDLSLTTPLQSTINTANALYFGSVQDQIFSPNQTYLQLGMATTVIRDHSLPWGDQPYVERTGSVSGSYFETSHLRVDRTEEIANLYLPSKDWLGKHRLQVGSDNEEIVYHQGYFRNPFLIEGEHGEPLQNVTFSGGQGYALPNTEVSSYAQDSWSVLPRFYVEPGVRFDWDTAVHDALFSPRIAATLMPREGGTTKLVGGIGMYSDASNLALLAEPLAGERTDYFYALAGQPLLQPSVETTFSIQPHLEEPRVWNGSAGVEQKLPGSIYFRGEYIEKREEDGWAYFDRGPVRFGQIAASYELRDAEQDRYDAVETVFRRAFKKRGDLVMLSYVRSMARSNAVLDFSLDNPVFAEQAGGPLPWDAPNRVMSWGIVPLVKKFDLAYTFDWRTGFPFSVFNQNQEVVGAPDSFRMPAYFSADAALERRISLFGFKWDIRAGFNDLTGRRNPYAVNNNIDSPQFLTYSSTQSRTLQAEIRLLGRK
jgi:hypothetical protein